MRMKSIAAITVLLAVGGCKSAPKEGPVLMPDPQAISGEAREWWDVYSVEFQADHKVRTKVGYVYRKFDPSGKGHYWVQNTAMDYVGFILPDMKAYRVVPAKTPGAPVESVFLGPSDLKGGVRRILGVSEIELEKKLETKSAPAPTAAKAPAAPAPAPSAESK